MANKNLIFVHGMGEGNYQNSYLDLYNLISKRYFELKNIELNNHYNFVKDINWSKQTDSLQLNIFNRIFPNTYYYSDPISANGLGELVDIASEIGTRLRNFVHFYIGDVIAYTTKYDNKIRENYIKSILPHVTKPFTIIAHSLGSVIFNDILYHSKIWKSNPNSLSKGFTEEEFEFYNKMNLTNPGNQIKTFDDFVTQVQKNFEIFVSIGSPIGLFLQQDLVKFGAKQHGYADSPLTDGLNQFWFNIYNDDDFFSYPVEPFFNDLQSKAKQTIFDHKVSNDMSLKAHGAYWNDENVANHIANIL